MLSGLFDQYPNLKIILGHLGQGLRYLLPHLQHRLDEQRDGERRSKAKRRPSCYFSANFWVTTSGHHHTRPFLEVVEQLGVEKVLFSVDYPYEQMDAASRWFNDLQIPNELKRKVGRDNADQLLDSKSVRFRVPPWPDLDLESIRLHRKSPLDSGTGGRH
jgi:2,3-dihydroxybenzoate decarboxylase